MVEQTPVVKREAPVVEQNSLVAELTGRADSRYGTTNSGTESADRTLPTNLPGSTGEWGNYKEATAKEATSEEATSEEATSVEESRAGAN